MKGDFIMLKFVKSITTAMGVYGKEVTKAWEYGMEIGGKETEK